MIVSVHDEDMKRADEDMKEAIEALKSVADEDMKEAVEALTPKFIPVCGAEQQCRGESDVLTDVFCCDLWGKPP